LLINFPVGKRVGGKDAIRIDRHAEGRLLHRKLLTVTLLDGRKACENRDDRYHHNPRQPRRVDRESTGFGVSAVSRDRHAVTLLRPADELNPG
jgi:hypothetical protein